MQRTKRRPEDVTPLLFRAPPHNQQVEEVLIACCIIDPDEVLTMCLERKLEAEHFRSQHCQILFHVLCQMSKASKAIDILTLRDWLTTSFVRGLPWKSKVAADPATSLHEAIGGDEVLIPLSSAAESITHAAEWLKTVQDYHTVRQLLQTVTLVANECFEREGAPAEEILQMAQKAIFAIDDAGGMGAPKSIRAGVAEWRQREKERRKRGGFGNICSGLDALDEITGGIENGQLIIIAADPKAGKTALAFKYIEEAVWPTRLHVPPTGVLIFSLEMIGSELAQRLACQRGCINYKRVKDGIGAEISKLQQVMPEIEQAPIHVVDDSDVTIFDIRAKARRHLIKHPETGLIVIDHMGLISPADRRAHRNDTNTEITRECKKMAKEFQRPVLLLCQMNRQNRKRKAKDDDSYESPTPAHIEYGSGAEQDANKMILIGLMAEGQREIVVAYQRDGGGGKFRPDFTAWCARFDNFGQGPGSRKYEPVQEEAPY